MSIHRLKPSEIAGKIEEPGKHADGGGLYLQVAQPGQASWVYRFTVAGKERWKSLGPASLYKLEEVREKAHELRKAKHSGTDPRAVVNAGLAKAAGKSFGEWLSEYLAEASPHWRGGETGQEATHYRQSFDKIPDFLKLPIDGIDEHSKNRALKIWDAFPVTRRKMGIRIDAILKFAATGKISNVMEYQSPRCAKSGPSLTIIICVRSIFGLATKESSHPSMMATSRATTSAVPPTADIVGQRGHVRKVPDSDIFDENDCKAARGHSGRPALRSPSEARSNARLSLNRFQRFVIEKFGDSVIMRRAASCASCSLPTASYLLK